jgi:hypothetical protein
LIRMAIWLQLRFLLLPVVNVGSILGSVNTRLGFNYLGQHEDDSLAIYTVENRDFVVCRLFFYLILSYSQCTSRKLPVFPKEVNNENRKYNIA